MPPRLPTQLRPHGRRGAILKEYATRPERQSTCFFCSLSLDLHRERIAQHPKKKASSAHTRRFETTAATATTATAAVTAPADVNANPRKELESILLSLQKHAAKYVNLSRLQLALNGLRQKPGDESIRVAILGLADGPAPANTAKEVLRLLLADPLKEPEAWEQEVERHDLAEPLMIRVGAENRQTESDITLTKGSLLREVHVPSTALNGHNLEILLADTSHFLPMLEKSAPDELVEDAVMVPSVSIPASNTSQQNSITTPVHKVLVVADGIHGVASVMSMPKLETPGMLGYAINIPEYKPAETNPLPFVPIDTSTARIGLGLVRKNISNAMEFEHLWFQSNVPKLVEWLKADILPTPEGVIKPPVRRLIASLLKNTSASIRAQERRLIEPYASTDTPTPLTPIERGLLEWAENAHSELQEQLDLAFSSRRWRKLGWWKLFWRVDDVGMLTSDILSQRFLPQTERSSIFLAGRMREAGVRLLQPSLISAAHPDTTAATSHRPVDPIPNLDSVEPSIRESNWPMNIPNARNYLLMETVPALQALAQKLVLQTLSTSGFMTALGALAYIGTLSTTLYEAGAVAALGTVWSMRRMQKQWETARDFWEGEVREEGRKAIRGVEEVMASALTDGDTRRGENSPAGTQNDLKKAHDLVVRAEKVLGELR